MSLSKDQKVRLGIFVMIGTIIALIMIAIPISSRLHNSQKMYVAYFSGESLSGLEQGAQVKFHGVPIGKVDRINYDPHDLTRVKAELSIQNDFPLKTDMYAQTGAMGITGLKYVEVLGGTNESQMLKPGSVIPTKASVIATITGKAEVIVGKIELLLNHLNTITEPDSLDEIKAILGNLVVVTDDFRKFFGKTAPDIQDMSSSIQQVIIRLDSISCDVKSITGTINKSLSQERLTSIVSSVDTSARSIKNLSETMTMLIKQSKEDYSVSLQNLREALENANSLMRELSENPSLLLRNEQQKERIIK
jgi:phospholipid/cholesterol/gamma-HCH transport system substrate-binding protein